ncbi:unnamed protein product [Pelagomonas calceolata]|uniref:Uncharacterized protein n=1 Tax=Pelagomonas calceolata TaxID=35677 RepID=A0A8J2X2K1_9STRA|nr:unnamed protein product [Pelagomonas calceolata]
MRARLPLLVAAAAAACDYYLDDGTCCNAGNSEGPQTLLKAPATLIASDGLKADLRLDLQYRRHPNEAWQPIGKDAVVPTHSRDAHVFVVRDDFGSVAHVHGAWEGSDFILRDVPFVSGGNHRILASFAVDANVLNICVDESSVHAHPTAGVPGHIWVHAATESSVSLPGTETTTQDPWDLSKTQNATLTTLVDGELPTAFSTPRLQCPGGPEAITLDLETPSLELAHAQCSRLTWQASAPLTPYLGAAAHILIARFNGDLMHTHATIPERVLGDPCAASFVGHFDDLTPLPTKLNHTVVGAVDFDEPGIYLVAAFVATGDDALAAFHTVLVGEACVAAEVVPHCAGEWRLPSTACEAGFPREPSPRPTLAPTTTPAPMSGSRGARTSSGGDGGGPKGNFKVVFGMIVFFVPLGLALLYCLRGRIVMFARKARRRVTAAVCATSGTTDCTCVEMPPQREFA